MIDPRLWADEHFGTLSDKAKILFVSCISNADDDGRLSGHTSNLRALAFRFDDISLNKIQEIRDEIQEKMKNFRVYRVNGCEYIQLLKWTDHQSIRSDRYKDSVLPGIDQSTTKCQPSDNQMTHKVKESKVKESKVNNSAIFQKIWEKYPKKVGRKSAYRHFNVTVKTENDCKRIETAVQNYLHSERVMRGFVQNAATWFNQWEDWVDFKEDVCQKCKGKGKYLSTTGYEITCECPAGKRL